MNIICVYCNDASAEKDDMEMEWEMWIEMEIEKSQWENEKSAYLTNMENGWVFFSLFPLFLNLRLFSHCIAV